MNTSDAEMTSADVEPEEIDLVDLPDGRLTPRAFALWLLIPGLIGLYGSFALMIEEILVLKDPDRIASCDLNVFVACGPAMDSAEGALLGFPNALVGVAAFAAISMLGVLLLVTRAVLPRWFLLAFTAGTWLAFVFVLFMMSTSLYQLGSLCPYCMVVWVAVVPLVVMTTAFARQERVLGPVGDRPDWFVRNRVVVLVAVYVALLMWIFTALGARIIDSL